MWGRSSIVYSRIIVDLFHWNLLQNLKVRELDRVQISGVSLNVIAQCHNNYRIYNMEMVQ